jgi:hypothetical protein
MWKQRKKIWGALRQNMNHKVSVRQKFDTMKVCLWSIVQNQGSRQIWEGPIGPCKQDEGPIGCRIKKEKFNNMYVTMIIINK